MPENYDILILGGGPSGLTAAIYTARAHLKTLCIAGNPPGGQLMWTTEVENFPGFENGIMGPALIETMRKQAEKFGTSFVNENVTSLSGNVKEGFNVVTDEGKEFKGKTVIICTGASAKWLELESEQRLRAKGVSACAVCDGFFFKDKEVAVVGAGDAAMEDAIYLTKYATKVHVLVRGDASKMRASKTMILHATSNPKIQFHYNIEVKEVLGDNFVTGIRVFDNLNNAESHMDIQGLFIAIGHVPNTGFLKGVVDLDHDHGYVMVKDNTKTSTEGIFVGGDVADYRYRQAITAAGLGCMAALDAEKYLTHTQNN